MNHIATVKQAAALSREAGIAAEAARRGAEVLQRFWQQLQTSQIREKSKGDLVTAADLAAEETITDFLKQEMPEAAIVSEEGTEHGGSSLVWYVDPLDGTTNFVQKFPVFAVSVGLAATRDRSQGDLVCGAVLNPVTGEFFYGSRGKGSYLNSERLKVSGKTDIGDAVIATGFPRRFHGELAVYLREFERIFPACRAVRRAGAAALDLCWTANATFDGFWEHHLAPWDIAAGVLIVEEAGGVCTDFNGERGFLASGDILGATPGVHPQVLELLHAARSEQP